MALFIFIQDLVNAFMPIIYTATFIKATAVVF